MESDEAVILDKEEIPVMKNYRKLQKEDQFRVQGYVDSLLEKHEEV
jgi:hypothetical protein